MVQLQEVVGDYQGFLATMLAEVKKAGFDLNDFVQMDHMCYRVTDMETYARKKEELQTVGTLLVETMINGRPIASYRLHEPVKIDSWRVDTIELPAPKDGSDFAEGLEHVEFVLYEDLPTFLQKHSGKTFNLQAADRGVNPEVGFKLSNGYGVKFHIVSLPAAIYLEKKLAATD
jgi:uncharacterized protein